ncbi:MAG: hypothetical protein JW995_03135 [Melioribacteraceae bacterium]|nr:hypothetical protein [Melioribacteraceae bacterium]
MLKFNGMLGLMLFVTVTTFYCQIISLNGEWEYLIDKNEVPSLSDIKKSKEWKSIIIPSSWHRTDSTLLDYQGIVWFRKSIGLETLSLQNRILLRFKAVDYAAKVFVNGSQVGSHEGGYTPFYFDITNNITEGINQIYVRVNDPAANDKGTDGISYYHIPHGKQDWYVQNSGIWQDVDLIIKPQSFISQVKITTDMKGKFLINTKVDNGNNAASSGTIDFELYSPRGEIVLEDNYEYNGEGELKIEGVLNEVELWDFKSPNLYKFILKYGEDEYIGKTGFRTFESVDGKLYLNGKSFYMRAALDQDFYPETIYETPSKEYLKDEMSKAIELGLNMLRCHIKIPDERYLEVADELGLLVWYEIPNWDGLNESVKERARDTFLKMLERDWNHPSLVIISLINESWGIDLNDSLQRKWLLGEYEFAKKYASGRLIVDNSACWGNYHLKTDINDYHTYWAVPEKHKKFSETVSEFSKRPDWLFSPHGDSGQKGDEVLILSEFGNWGLPVLPDTLPFWFNRQFYDVEVSLPMGIYDRFNDYKMDRIFNSYDDLALESQYAQAHALKYEIEEIRLHSELQGYVITEFTDINWESNGILDMWRNYKANSTVLKTVQKDDLIIARPDKYNYWTGEEIKIDLYFSHFSNTEIKNPVVKWETAAGMQETFSVTEKTVLADVSKIAELKLVAGKTEKPEKKKMNFSLWSDGLQIASNFIELFIYPAVSETQDFQNILITDSISDDLLESVHKGKNLLLLVNGRDAFNDSSLFKILPRDSEWIDGNWASALNWIDPEHFVFRDISFRKSLGFEAYEAFPKFVISDLNPEYFSSVYSGMFVGWLHLNCANLLEFNYGNGRILITTFDFSNMDDPYTRTLYGNIIGYINSDEFNPKYKINFDSRR